MKHYLWNMLANIQNGQLVNKSFILQKKTKFCESLLNILWDEGYISGYKIVTKKKNILKIYLKYSKNLPVISSLNSLTKPGKRIYYSINQLWKINSTKGLLIISTNKGLLTLSDCKKFKVGGEPIVIVK